MYRSIQCQYWRESYRHGLGTEKKKFRKSYIHRFKRPFRILQLVFDEPKVGSEGFAKAGTLRSEFVIAVEGTVQKRSAAVNENLKTGDIEVIAESIRILSESQTPPFQIEENSQTKDEIRLKYRYLDLRRPDIQRNLMLRSKVAYLMRDFMAKEGFLEIETPILCKSTPEGKRLSGAKPYTSGQLLCIAAVTTAFQTASDGIRI